jgi:hypothetical protein
MLHLIWPCAASCALAASAAARSLSFSFSFSLSFAAGPVGTCDGTASCIRSKTRGVTQVHYCHMAPPASTVKGPARGEHSASAGVNNTRKAQWRTEVSATFSSCSRMGS